MRWLICVLTLAACGHAPAVRTDAPQLWEWPSEKYPLPVRIHEGLLCAETVVQGIAWWEDLTGRRLFDPPVVAPAGAFSDVPFAGVSVRHMPTFPGGPNGTAHALFAHRPGLLFGVDIGLASCLSITVRHELGHALGLGHSDDPRSVMYAVASATGGTSVTGPDLDIVRCDAPLR